MDKLFVFFVIALFANGAFGQYYNNNRISSAITTQSAAIRECIRSCPVTSEYNPVCGTDNVTYNNPGSLICAQTCGVKVSVLRKSRCPPPTPVD